MRRRSAISRPDRPSDASKIAFASLAEKLRSAGYALFDVQVQNEHLESLGYIERSEHPTDGRMVVLRISDKGEAMIAEFRELRNRTLAAAIDSLDADERATLERAIPILARLAEA